MRSARKAKSEAVGATTAENCRGGSWACGTPSPGRWPPPPRGPVPEAPTVGDPVGPPLLLVEGVDAGFAALVVCQEGASHPLGPAGFAALAAVGDVDHPEHVAAPGGLVHTDQQLADEQVLVRCGPEHSFQHVPAKQPTLGPGCGSTSAMIRFAPSGSFHQPVPVRERRSWTSSGTPARSNPDRI